MTEEVIVLRYGHRSYRDLRVTSHCCLVARAFGAKKIIIEGEEDESIKKTIKTMNDRWGSDFSIEFTKSWFKELKKYKKQGYESIHLTMYGENINKLEEELQELKKIIVIIGSQKVEKQVYEEAGYNMAIGNQPHSEISSLAVFLDRIFKGKQLEKKYEKAKYEIIGDKTGLKKIAKKDLV